MHPHLGEVCPQDLGNSNFQLLRRNGYRTLIDFVRGGEFGPLATLHGLNFSNIQLYDLSIDLLARP
jgi:hypothetical protein